MLTSDHDLLRHYAEDRSQPAFGELVRRHLDLVYGVARRFVGSPELAEEVAQSVFLDLSRAAPGFNPRTPVVAWLHVVARRAAIDARRSESRRQNRERAVHEFSTVQTPPPPWAQLEPSIDELLETLPAADRSALVLRYFENKGLREVGETLGMSEDAAQKRVSRALDQLRRAFVKRGVSLTAAGLAGALSAHAAPAAPAALASAISAALPVSTTLALGAVLSPAALEGTRSFATFVVKKYLIAGFAAALTGAVVFESIALFAQRNELADLRGRATALDADRLRLTGEQAARTAELTSVRSAQSQFDKASATRNRTFEPELRALLERMTRLKRLAKDRPELAIPEFTLLDEDDWLSVSREVDFETEKKVRSALAFLRSTAKQRFSAYLRDALMQYTAAHDGRLPRDASELAPHLPANVDSAALARYAILQAGQIGDLPVRSRLFQEKMPVDEELDTRFWTGSTESGNIGSFAAVSDDQMRAAVLRFRAARGDRWPASGEELLPFFPAALPALTEKIFRETPLSEFAPVLLRRFIENPPTQK